MLSLNKSKTIEPTCFSHLHCRPRGVTVCWEVTEHLIYSSIQNTVGQGDYYYIQIQRVPCCQADCCREF